MSQNPRQAAAVRQVYGTMGPVAKGLKEGVKSHVLAARFAAAGDPSIVGGIKAELQCEDTKIRNVAVKTLSHLAGHRPQWLLGELDSFLGLLTSEENIWKWAAMDVAGHLAGVDEERKIGDAVIKVLIAALEDESMVTAAHGVDNLVRIARVRPNFHSQALAELFRVESIPRRAAGRLLPSLSAVNHAAALTFLNRLAMSDGRAGVKATKIIGKLDRG